MLVGFPIVDAPDVVPPTATLMAFAGATLAIVALPGPSVAYVVTRSIEHGRLGGFCSVLGIETGAALHVVAASTGLAALLESAPAAHTSLRWAGAAYLLALAVQQFRRSSGLDGGSSPSASPLRLYRDGVLVDLLNPKTALFFVAFLPQFVDPAQGSVAQQIGVLGLCFVVLALVCDGGYAFAAGGVAGRVQSSPRAAEAVRLGAGVVYLALAGAALLA